MYLCKMGNRELIEKIVLDVLHMTEDHNNKCVHDYDYVEISKNIAERIEPPISLTNMPPELTAENGAKSLLNGEFKESIEVDNPEYCDCGECHYCEDIQDEDVSDTITIDVPVQWTTIKDIYRKIVDHYMR